MSFWDEYWDDASGLREEFIVSLRSSPDREKLKAWVEHLCLHYQYFPKSVDNYFSFNEAIFHLAAEHLGLLDDPKFQHVDASELSHIFKIWPRFKEYCEDSCSGIDAWTLLKFKCPIAHEVDGDLIKAALQLAE